MDMRILLLGGAALFAGLGLAATFLLDEDEMRTLTTTPELVLAGEPTRVTPTPAQREFRKMAVVADEIPECHAPRPPNGLSPKAYVRNSYGAILEILATQRWQETGSCECFFGEFTWDDVVLAAPNFERTDGISLRYDFLELRARADELSAQRSITCSD